MVLSSLFSQREGSVAQFEHRDVGVGAGFDGSDRSFIAEDLGRSGGTAHYDLVEWKAKVRGKPRGMPGSEESRLPVSQCSPGNAGALGTLGPSRDEIRPRRQAAAQHSSKA